LLSASRIEYLNSLHQKKFRRKENRFVLEGHRLIDQALSANAEIEEVWMTKKSLESPNGKDLFQQIENKKIPWSITPDKIIRQVSASLNDKGIIALDPTPVYKKYKHHLNSPCTWMESLIPAIWEPFLEQRPGLEYNLFSALPNV